MSAQIMSRKEFSHSSQPSHNDRQEEPKETRYNWRKNTRHYSKRAFRCVFPFSQKVNVCSELQELMSVTSTQRIVQEHTVFKFANTEIIKRGTVLKKQTTASQRNPWIFFLATSPSVRCMLFQISKAKVSSCFPHTYTLNVHLQCPSDLAPMQCLHPWDVFSREFSPRHEHRERMPYWRIQSSRPFCYQCGFGIPRSLLQCA